jgi:acyl CoA:acetate/3-ketoacid CoA transferase alpha subunit
LEKIQALLKSQDAQVLKSEQFKPRIQTQLLANQNKLFSLLNNQTWQTTELGNAIIPSKITDFISCWGGSNTSDKEALYLSVENRCQLDEQIYLHHDLRTGGVEVEFLFAGLFERGQKQSVTKLNVRWIGHRQG